MEKKALRSTVKQQLSLLPQSSVLHQSAQIAQLLFQTREYQAAKNVSVYVSKEGASEIATDEIIAHILASGRGCFIPRCVSRTKMEMVRLQSLDDLASLPLNRMGIREPVLTEKRETMYEAGGADLIVMPLLAFDAQGWRIGHGAGYYDRFLEEVDAFNAAASGQGEVKQTSTIAIALREQQVAGEIPRDKYDRKPGVILTAARE
ncbi:5-formyltetrahydrofolate cyclo-ligase [Chytriomyces sp. MP71]|nr:5-formyltetrahydrofolate cyclo-ligase [Chytriomyces sp. MP71]